MLYPFTSVLIIANLVALFLSAIKSPPKWISWWPIGLIIITLLQLIIDGFYQTLVLVYFTSVILSAIGFYRWREYKPKPKSLFRFIRIGWGIVWRLANIIILATSLIFTLSFGKDNTFLPTLFMNSRADYSNLSWGEAFDQMNTNLSDNYAFGDWKAVNWDSLHTIYKPHIIKAEQSADTAAYYLALRKYLFSIPDGHLSINGNDFDQKKAAIGGGYGFAAIQLDDGRVIAHIIQEDGPAQNAGMAWGAEILTWDYRPIKTVLEEISTLWAPNPCATLEGIQINKLNLLTRSSIGKQLTLTFQNPGEKDIYQVILSAIDDDMSLYKKDIMMGMPILKFDLNSKPIEYRILPNNYGYLKILMEIPTLGDFDPVGTVCKAVETFNTALVPGVIIDLRINGGGIDGMTPMMMSYFTNQLMLYEHVAYKDEHEQLKIAGEILLKPGTPNYTGPIAVLISNRTMSTGEGFPLIVQSLNRGSVVGFYGTNGSFGMAGSSINMPAGYSIDYPNGASLDKDGNIQLDSDQFLQGGVEPDNRIPLNMESLRAIFIDGKDYVLETAIATIKENIED